VEVVKAFPTANDTKLESVVPASSQTMMDLVRMDYLFHRKWMRSKGFAAKCYQAGKWERCKYLKMVDLVGIEPTTSSMPFLIFDWSEATRGKRE
jgi:hypothetical protein